ncbi:MAG: alanine/glycine:cation symporter family protein [Gammaproteobacteria bacterium]
MDAFFSFLNAVNAVMLSVPVLLTLLGMGILFTFWSGFCQYRSLTHGVKLVSGTGIDASHGKGVLTHFQALSAALSATVGLGNIGGVAIAVGIGGPGAVFWMWMVGLAGMALKTTEVTLSMLYRNTDDPQNPHGGTMWVAKHGLGSLPGMARWGAWIGAAFCLPLILFGITGGNMFQAWNVAEISRAYFGVPTWISGLIMAVVVGAVILGGIQRIGRIAGTLVPVMCAVYVLAGIFVLVSNAGQLPEALRLIFSSAFAPAQATGAFIGATTGVAFIFGMKRALFSSEAGLGSAPIAHSAVKTPEPVTEGVVAGLEPFIDTLVVCTITALVILVSGVWNRGPVSPWPVEPALVEVAPQQWAPSTTQLPGDGAGLKAGDPVFVVVDSGGERARLMGTVTAEGGIQWRPLGAPAAPRMAEAGLFADYPAATLTAKAFDSAQPGLGRWMVVITVWLFAISTMITWSYYGEQGVVYLLGTGAVKPYRFLWCVLILVTCLGFIRTDLELDTVSTVALGFMLAINLPTMLVLGGHAMRAYKDYFRRLEAGEIGRR